MPAVPPGPVLPAAARAGGCTGGTGSTGDAGTDGVGIQLVRLRKTMESFRARVLEVSGHGLEGSGLGVLYHLSSSGPMRTSSLAERLGLDPSTTSRHVSALERSGHVERVADPADGRAFLLRATDAGTRAFEETRALRNALVARALQDWTPEEVDAFAATLARFNDAVADLGPEDALPTAPRTTAPRPDPLRPDPHRHDPTRKDRG